MNLESFEINLWRKWRRNDTGATYSFIPGQYDNENFKEFHTALMVTADTRTFRIGFKVYEENEKPMLQIVETVYEIKRIDGKSKPATMILIDSSKNEIHFTEEK